MKKIALIHSGEAYAPEISVYKQFLEMSGYYVQVFKEANESKLQSFDVEWHFMGIDMSKRRGVRLKIHEYLSLSVPPFPKLKDNVKKLCNSKPDLRIFGSAMIEKELNFKDNIPVCYRDAGISPDFFKKSKNIIPEFDFVYTGSTDKTRKIDQLLLYFQEKLPGAKLLIIGTPRTSLSKRILRHSAFTFTGRIRYDEVPVWLQKARFGINFVPNVFPYNQQSSYKLLEYCSIGLPVITTEYAWVNKFEREMNARFYKLATDLSNLKMSLIEEFDFCIPDVTKFTWEKVLAQSRILNFLNEKSA